MVLLAAIVAVVTYILFFSRQIFFFTYEPEYYENLYYHSQWNIPGSSRGISDGMLYKFVGYRLVEGENPFYLNYEVPPFGKYLYGMSAYLTGNPYWVSLVIYLASLGVFFLFSKKLFKDNKIGLAVLLLFVTAPFVATQIRDTMLDLPLTFLFLTHTYFFVKYLIDKKILYLGLAGIFLGLATGTKIGVYTPAIGILGILILLWDRKWFKEPLFYTASVFAGYCFSYISYFIRHPNPIPWAKLHNKQLEFYLSPESNVDHLNQWRGIFMNTYQGWWDIGKISFGDWSPLLPLGVLAAVAVLAIALKRREKIWVYISGLTLIFLAINTLISFWPRYLMPAVPGFALLVGYFFKKNMAKYWWVLVILAILNLPFLANSMAGKNYFSNSEAVGSFISKRAYRELYRSIDPGQRKTIPEQEFISDLENFYETLGVKKINLKIEDIKESGSTIETRYSIEYQTWYGNLSFKPVFEFKDVNNQAMLVWKWDYLWPGYSPEKKIVTEEGQLPVLMIRRGGKPVALPGDGKAVYIITRHIEWPKTLDELEKVTIKNSSLMIGDSIKQSVPDDFPRYVGILKEYEEDAERKAESIKGVKLRKIKYLLPVEGAPKKDISELIYDVYTKRPELFQINADIYFGEGDNKIYIKKAEPSNSGVILDL
jgi:hypothetical protein